MLHHLKQHLVVSDVICRATAVDDLLKIYSDLHLLARFALVFIRTCSAHSLLAISPASFFTLTSSKASCTALIVWVGRATYISTGCCTVSSEGQPKIGKTRAIDPPKA